jgi:hypothetical protein
MIIIEAKSRNIKKILSPTRAIPEDMFSNID